MTTPSQNARKRWAAIWLRRLSTDRITRGAPLDPSEQARGLVTYIKSGSAHLIHAVDDAAALLGIAPGMALADARALQPRMRVEEADHTADSTLLEEIADVCEMWSPSIAIDSPDGITLEISGATHLFGGEGGLRSAILNWFADRYLSARVAIADTPAAAWALARAGRITIAKQGETEAALRPLSVSLLRLDDDCVELLRRLGLNTIGSVIDRPSMPMAARVSEQVAKHLGEALGALRPALTFRRPPPPVSVLRRFLEPLVTAEAILIGVANAGEEVAAELTTRGEGVRRLRLVLFETSARGRQIEVGFSQPECDVPLLMRPLREKLMSPDLGFDFEFGIEALRLDVLAAERIDPARFSDSARLADALSGRLGGDRVLRISYGDSHQPECASVLSSALERELTAPAFPTTERPLLLLDHPEPIDAIATVPDGPPRQFRWRRVVREVARAEGPERIAPDWLDPQAGGTRDYFRVEDKTGVRYWLCREGLYGRETDAPRWFVHGLFP